MRIIALGLVIVSTFATVAAACKAATEDAPALSRANFLFRESSQAIRSIADVTSVLDASVALSDAGHDVRSLKSSLRTAGRPGVLLIAPDIIQLEALKSVAADTQGRANVVALVASPKTSIVLDDSSIAAAPGIPDVPVLVVPRSAFDQLLAKTGQDVKSLYGLYVFDMHGAAVWFSDWAHWQGYTHDASIIATTIASIVAAEDRARQAQEATGGSNARKGKSPEGDAPRTSPTTSMRRKDKPARRKSELLTIPTDNRTPKATRLEVIVKSVEQRAVLVNVWATWCEPCRKEFPMVARLVADHKGEIQYVGIVTDAASSPGAKDRIDRISPAALRGMQYALLDVHILSRLFPTRSYDAPRNVSVPLFALLDAGGHVVFRCEGSLLDPQNSAALQVALGKLASQADRP